MMKQKGLTVGKLAKAATVNVETLRYYERRGLLPEPPRTESGYRLYPKSAVERLRFIKGAQALGFTLEEIQELLNLRMDEQAHHADVRQRAEEKVVDIEHKIQALMAMKVALQELIEQCHGDGPMGECPILEALPSYFHHQDN
ncbi:MAG TPA: MerR family transcriptional regulator [Anaerolineae bacterium]|nr:MerR family transcriptional regulator [Anaerolineae bacterium]